MKFDLWPKEFEDPQLENKTCDLKKIKIIQKAIKSNILNEKNPLAMFYDLSRFERTINQVKIFPSNWIHTSALKSNPLKGMMQILKDNGLGYESASLGELSQALSMKIEPHKIVFDSPAKTLEELELALTSGVVINIDNFQELVKIEKILKEKKIKNPTVGVRINPQVGLGKIKAMSTSGSTSKFGIPSNEYKNELIEAYKKNNWLKGVHVHVGSQGCGMDLMISGIRQAIDFAKNINQIVGKKQVTFIDVGGGLPVNFDNESDVSEDAISFQDYFTIMKKKIVQNYLRMNFEFIRNLVEDTTQNLDL